LKVKLSQTLWVSFGSAIGACVRWGVGVAQSGAEVTSAVPWGTLAVNVAGSVLIGLYAAMAGPKGPMRGGEAQHLFVMAGFCGGFTTFSLFSAEVLLLLQAGDAVGAGVLLLVSTVTWLAGAWVGHRSGGQLTSRYLLRR
jgi:CrcB protein